MRRATLILLVLSAAFCIFVFYSLLHLEPLHISGERLEHLGNSVVVTGKVVNGGSKPQTAGLKVQLYDRAGRRLAVEDVTLGRLAPGQSVAFSSHPINASEAENFTIQIDHGTNMYGN
jgi:hypothetical protein